MKILIITEYYRDEALNGSEVLCGALIDRLAKIHEVAIIARAPKEPSVRQATLQLDDATASDHSALVTFLGRHVSMADYDLVYNLGALIFGCNVVQVLVPSDGRVPLVNHFQALLGPYAREEGLHEQLQQLNAAGQRNAAARAAMNIFASQAEALIAGGAGYPLSGATTVVVPNGLPLGEFEGVGADPWFLGPAGQNRPRPHVIACAGRFADFTKGADLVYRAFVELRKDRDDVFLLSIGNSNRFAHLLRSLPRDSYHLSGWLPRRRFLATLAAADLFVMPSRYEPFGLIALEAQMLGVAVLANAVGGLAEIVHHEVGGLLALREDGSLGLYLGMKRLLENSGRLRQMGMAGRDLVAVEYDIERIATVIDKQLRRARLTRRAETPV